MSVYIPRYGGMTHKSGADQFSASRVSSLSFRVTPIEYCGRDTAHATGFFWSYRDQQFLVTNWHVVTWIDPFTGSCLGDKFDFYVPERIRIFATTWPHLDDNPDYMVPSRKPIEIDLYRDGKPLWIQHPNFEKERIDLIALPLEPGTLECRNGKDPAFNGFGFESLFHMVGSDIFAIGYPFKSYEGAMAGLWKRGSFASEPLLAIDSRPLFFADILGTKGMSGSPVVKRVFGPAAYSDLTIHTDNICCDEFVGVYAGRLNSTEIDRVGLGYVWHGQLVQEIVENGVAGTTS